MWCIPPKANAEFIWKMEDVLEVYKRPYDPLRPVVCMDETSKQLIGETRSPVDAAPGRPRRVDYEYERKGVADLFMFFEPLRGWRRVWITPQRRKVEWACCVKQLLDGTETGRVTQGGCPPRVPTDPDLPVKGASGSSSHDFATPPTKL